MVKSALLWTSFSIAHLACLLAGSVTGLAAEPESSAVWKNQVESDWLRQALPRSGGLTAREDASGGCDGVKNGKIGFHTEHEDKPWWQVDLGKTYSLSKALLFNRTDYPVAPPRARYVMLLLSTDGRKWREAYRHDGSLFFGYPNNDPLEVDLKGAEARFVRAQLPHAGYLHLDEVEVYGVETGEKNLALKRPADQSSVSQWSTPPRFPLPARALDRSALKTAAIAALRLARTTLSFVRESSAPSRGSTKALATALRAMESRIAAADDSADWRKLYLRTRWLRRRIILSHPALDFDRLLINKRPPPIISHMCDQYLGRWSRPGPGLCTLDHWQEEPKSSPLLSDKLPLGSVLHPDLSFDGRRVIFSFCDHTLPEIHVSKMPECRTAMGVGGLIDYVQKGGRRQFFIYEAEVDGSSVRQLTGTPSDPLAGEDGRQTVLIEDLDPCYLPGGGFVFVSTRCQSFGRCHWGRYTPSFVLYRADADGSNIRRISYGELNEWDPSVLPDGRLLFTRWDYVNRHNTFFQSLWVGRPDGTNVAHFYGNASRNPCMISEALAIPGSRKIVSTATAHHSYTAGSIITIDPDRGQEGLAPIRRVTPEVKFPETEGWSQGNFATPYPLSPVLERSEGEDIFLAAYSSDRLPLSWEPRNAPPVNGYAIYLIDTLGGRELIYRDREMSCFSPIPIRSRPEPPVLPSNLADGQEDGVFVVQDVYQGSHLPRGSVSRLRVIRLYPQPTAGVPERSIVRDELVKGIVGTAPVGADGSVAFRAPADAPLMFQLLDENGMAVMTMRSQTHLRPGETLSCVGCHEPRNTSPISAKMYRAKVLTLTPPVGPRYDGGFSFARTVQPVLDRYCIRCHGLDVKETKVNLLGALTVRFNVAYESLVGRSGLVALAHSNRETDVSKPREYYAHGGKLAVYLLGQHKKYVVLNSESFQRILDWLDINGQYYGDYSWNRSERRTPSAEIQGALRQRVRAQCGTCHAAMSDDPLAALINVAEPRESRVLQAPLAVKGGGWGLCQGETWRSTTNAKYQEMLDVVLKAAGSAHPSSSNGTCGLKPCRCGGCWVAKLRKTGM